MKEKKEKSNVRRYVTLKDDTFRCIKVLHKSVGGTLQGIVDEAIRFYCVSNPFIMGNLKFKEYVGTELIEEWKERKRVHDEYEYHEWIKWITRNGQQMLPFTDEELK